MATDRQSWEPLQATKAALAGAAPELMSELLLRATNIASDIAGPAFFEVVRRAMARYYKSRDRPAPVSDVHCALAELAKPGQIGSGIDDIVTFNFDELLEVTMIRHYGQATTLASYNGEWLEITLPQRGPVQVWHPHGFVPQFQDRERALANPDIVFSQAAYEHIYGNESSLANNVLNASLRTKTCLFIGSSFTDVYQRKQLAVAHAAQPGWYHYAIMKRPSLPADSGDAPYLSAAEYAAISEDLLGLGVRPLWIDRWEVLPSAIRRLARPPFLSLNYANHDFCAGFEESPYISELYQFG